MWFDFVAWVAVVIAVIVASGIVITLSWSGSWAFKVISCASAVAPSIMIPFAPIPSPLIVELPNEKESIVGLVKVLFVSVCEAVNWTTSEIAKVTVLLVALLPIFEPPEKVNVSLGKIILCPVPLSGAISKSWAAIVSSTYFLKLCCVTTFVALLLAISSSSNTAVPETPVLKTGLVSVGLVNVLFVKVSVAVIKETVPVAFGKVNVLSAVGSVTARVVSKLSSVSPSNIIDPPLKIWLSVDMVVKSVFNAVILSTTSVALAIIPLAPVIPEISPISSAVPLNSNLNLFNVSPAAMLLSAICHTYN